MFDIVNDELIDDLCFEWLGNQITPNQSSYVIPHPFFLQCNAALANEILEDFIRFSLHRDVLSELVR